MLGILQPNQSSGANGAGGPSGPDDVVRLSLPAAPEYIRLARLTASGLASRMGFTIDELEDIRIAVDELCYLLVGDDARGGRIELAYRVDGTVLTVEGRAAVRRPASDLSPMSARILAVVAEEHEIIRDNEGVAFRVVHRHRG